MPPPLHPDPGRSGEDGGPRSMVDDRGGQREEKTTADDHERHLEREITEESGQNAREGEPNGREQQTSASSEQGEYENAEKNEEPRYRSESDDEAASASGDDEQSQDRRDTQENKHGEAGEEASQAGSAEEDKPEEGKTGIPTEEIWTALVSALKAHPKGTYLVEWKSTVKTLFKIEHDRLPIRSHLVPQQKQRYPNLTDAEVTDLLEFIAVAQEKEPMQYADWQRRVAIICKKLYAEPRMLSDILVQTTSQFRWTPAPVLDKWSQVVKGFRVHENTPQGQHRVEFKPFMFNPPKTTSKDSSRCACDGVSKEVRVS
ncbi:hypothetical protein PHYSODRAFT_305131 [Phytophthora sojae]|uniref:Uncharacterized protein n=1 Tax=Phytophthora sojae (strain P6497) TaxID=1094619 RepID=G5A4U2_PHYSP|nr:hypothetical protein PHYSODRAFT_305131 [Phytophthora sojae]EGZ09692.1 hypothetical protein PHYSODRAFT_305131 [Phytophthora sojae]|eukprot:XP_009534553.1 hypothetical protein PHYSODRAFT_305131 [Phytophthora sojae]